MRAPHVTIDTRWQRPDPALVERFRDVPSGNVSDAAGRVADLPNAIKPVTGMVRFCGIALTADNGPTGNFAVWAALEHIQPGDVLVIATGGARQRAVIGDLLAGFAYNGGAVAIVTDGMIRDVEQLDALGKPVFAGGVTPVGPVGEGDCCIGGAVTLGEQVIRSGDVIVGDADGIAVVPQAMLAEAAAELDRITAREQGMEAQIMAGASVPDRAADVLSRATKTILE
jgi:4-hydroxy-4-methyl-2-oxoglutarate aldolase